MPLTKEIKMGIYTKGSGIRLIGELDLITQDEGHKDEAIYLVTMAMMRDPREPIGEKEMKEYENAVKSMFRDHRHDYKAKDRAEADKFIEYNIGSWEEVRSLSKI